MNKNQRGDFEILFCNISFAYYFILKYELNVIITIANKMIKFIA